jgi:genome maintenance exonuclease 1
MDYSKLVPIENENVNRPMGNFIHLPKPDLPPIKVINLGGQRHYVTPDNNKYPSITTLLGAKDKPWLTDWRNSLGPEKADKETKRAAERGDALHKLTEYYIQNKLTTDICKPIKYEYVNQFNQIRMWLNKINNIRAQETPLYSDVLKIAGRVDCIAEYEGVLSVIDFKTSSNPKSREMIEDYFLQCTAYALMWEELTGQHIEDLTIIMSVEKGIVPLIFKEKTSKYISPLVKRIREYYKDHK